MSAQLKPSDILASFFAKVADLVGTGQLGGVGRAVIYIRGEPPGMRLRPPEIVLTYPIQADSETIAELEAALMWMRTPVDAAEPQRGGAKPC